MYYSILIEYQVKTRKGTDTNTVTQIDEEDLNKLKDRIVKPYVTGEQFYVDGFCLNATKVSRIKIVQSELTIKELMREKQARLNEPGSSVTVLYTYKPRDIINGSDHIKDITDEVLTEVKTELRRNSSNIEEAKNSKNPDSNKTQPNNKVFIVHGRDNAAREEVARFVEKFGLKAVILNEQANLGKTLIEKIEEYTDVGFAVVLYTPCDQGGLNKEKLNLQPRARQNVVFEHGYLLARLGRKRVCALRKKDVEVPSDMNGIVYVEYQDNGDWKLKLAQEMKKADLAVDMNLLF